MPTYNKEFVLFLAGQESPRTFRFIYDVVTLGIYLFRDSCTAKFKQQHYSCFNFYYFRVHWSEDYHPAARQHRGQDRPPGDDLPPGRLRVLVLPFTFYAH